jgi:hypothetical protein
MAYYFRIDISDDNFNHVFPIVCYLSSETAGSSTASTDEEIIVISDWHLGHFFLLSFSPFSISVWPQLVQEYTEVATTTEEWHSPFL